MSIKNILMIGCGSVGQGLLPLMRQRFANTFNMHVITADERGREVAEKYGATFEVNPLTVHNAWALIPELLEGCHLCINVSVDVSSEFLVKECQKRGVMYIDTCVEPWAGGYHQDDIAKTTNYYLRETILADRRRGKATAMIACGANPGLVSLLVKNGLKALSESRGVSFGLTTSYAQLAKKLGIKVIQIAERDSQDDGKPYEEGKFYNTWSVDGFLSEAHQPAEMGWGSHERELPENAVEHGFGSLCGIYLNQRSVDTKVKSWVPSVGEQEAYLITHHEALSISEYLTTGDYSPTVYYAYHPCEKAVKSLEWWRKHGGQLKDEDKVVLQAEDIVSGQDELGVLFVWDGGAFWYGSTLTIDQAKHLVPHNSATTLQVTATMVGAINSLYYVKSEQAKGIIEADELDPYAVMNVASPYLGEVGGVMTDWQPGKDLSFNSFLVKGQEQE